MVPTYKCDTCIYTVYNCSSIHIFLVYTIQFFIFFCKMCPYQSISGKNDIVSPRGSHGAHALDPNPIHDRIKTKVGRKSHLFLLLILRKKENPAPFSFYCQDWTGISYTYSRFPFPTWNKTNSNSHTLTLSENQEWGREAPEKTLLRLQSRRPHHPPVALAWSSVSTVVVTGAAPIPPPITNTSPPRISSELRSSPSSEYVTSFFFFFRFYLCRIEIERE